MNKYMSVNRIKKLCSAVLSTVMLMTLWGCGRGEVPVSGGMRLAGSLNVDSEVSYTDDSPVQVAEEAFSSADGLCTIVKYPYYYDVTLDYTKGTPAEVGEAYALTILQAVPDYEENLEPYLFENIRSAFSGRDINMKALETRILTLESSIPGEYREEIESFARAISCGEEGYLENGKLSYIEALTMQLIPDALRPTACSALSVSGDLTASGERITMRNLEWSLGSSAQMTGIHSVTHMNRNGGSITSIAMLGLLDMITAVNSYGVMIGILDVGSVNAMPFVYEDKKCYTFEIRYALDHFETAKDDINRFVKYNRWVNDITLFTVAEMKGIMAHEVVDQYEVVNVHNSGTVHTVIVDYATGGIHVAFTIGGCADDIPEYVLVGNYM